VKRLLDYLSPEEAAGVLPPRRHATWPYEGHIRLASVSTGNVWDLKLGPYYDGNIQAVDIKQRVRARDGWVDDGHWVCVGVVTDPQYLFSRPSDFELSYIAQYLALKFDEKNFIGRGYL
jgi:hypothetical protein